MWWWIGISALLVLLLIVTAASPLTALIYLIKAGKDEHAVLKIKGLYGLLRYHYELPVFELERWWESIDFKSEHKGFETSGQSEQTMTIQAFIKRTMDIAAVIRSTEGLMERMRRMLKRMRCTEFRWNTYIGVADAAGTAIVTGWVWAIKSMFLWTLFRKIRLDVRPAVMVNPQYNQNRFQTELRIRLTVPLGTILWHSGGMYVCLRRNKSSFETLKRLLNRGGMAVSPAK
jgi:hypothetical protein